MEAEVGEAVLKMNFGEYLGKLLSEKHLSINEVSMRSHVNSGHLSKVVRGERGVPKPDTIKAIAMAIGVPYEEMMRHANYFEEGWLPEGATFKAFGDRLRALRVKHGLNQEDIGSWFGMGKSTVSGWESGRIPHGTILAEIATR